MKLLNRLSPPVTDLIRLDHSQVLETFHQFHPGAAPDKKRALVDSACVALEIHMQLEEELFYPALRELAPDTTIVEKSEPEHAEIRELIARLRALLPGEVEHDRCFMELMRDVMHHVADEETTLLPAAEQLLAERLHELGAEMTRRRLQLMSERAGEIASNTLRAMPESLLLMGAGALSTGACLFSRLPRPWPHPRA